jgi:hypothetical protein
MDTSTYNEWILRNFVAGVGSFGIMLDLDGFTDAGDPSAPKIYNNDVFGCRVSGIYVNDLLNNQAVIVNNIIQDNHDELGDTTDYIFGGTLPSTFPDGRFMYNDLTVGGNSPYCADEFGNICLEPGLSNPALGYDGAGNVGLSSFEIADPQYYEPGYPDSNDNFVISIADEQIGYQITAVYYEPYNGEGVVYFFGNHSGPIPEDEMVMRWRVGWTDVNLDWSLNGNTVHCYQTGCSDGNNGYYDIGAKGYTNELISPIPPEFPGE